MKLLFVGDVVGKPGRRALVNHPPPAGRPPPGGLHDRQRRERGRRLRGDPGHHGRVRAAGIHCYTSGNHIWDKKEGVASSTRIPHLLRPANYPEGNPGKGVTWARPRPGSRWR